MNLTLDIPDIHLFEIVESSVRRFFRETEIGDSDAVRHINGRIKSQLRDEIERQLAAIDIDSEVKSHVDALLHSVVQSVVEKEIERRAKMAVKSAIIK
jgi:hypothetical protein